ncbi:MAG TPA: altronate dehydratase family protein [Blastocatellia bacterium]
MLVGLESGLAVSPVIRLNANDDVVIARYQIAAGTSVLEENVISLDPIPAGHKMAARRIPAGQFVRRYNQIIGVASQEIAPGAHVHTHNLKMAEFERDYAFSVDARPTNFVKDAATFRGIVRPDGRVGTRNFIGVLTTVNCSATVARAISDYFRKDIRPDALADFPNVDGVVGLAHGMGCGVDAEGEGLRILRRTLAGYACHPNFAAVIIVGLGCETNQISGLLQDYGLHQNQQLRAFTIQDTGGTAKAVARGIEFVKSMLPEANGIERRPVPVDKLIVGLQCGGSDGYSGITANPALGAAVDLLVQNGGTAILSETPEIYGAEHLLTRRAVSPEVGRKLLKRFDWWKAYCAANGAEMNNNPSAGNKAGGLTTVLEKSLGGVTKAGTTDLVDVYEYAEPVTARGLVYMDTPGFDPTSATGQVAGGANLICFTTGRGSAYGCQPSPSLKLSTNTALWRRQEDDLDINCGDILEGRSTIEQTAACIFEMMLECASGKRTKSEIHGYGQNEFVPWQISVVM